MSYFPQDDNPNITASFASPITPQIADIIAIHQLYGKPVATNAGDTVYGYQSTVDGYLGEFFSLWTGDNNPFVGIGWASGGQVSQPELVDLDGDGDLDLLFGTNPITQDRRVEDGRIHYYENIGTATEPDFMLRTGEDNPPTGIEPGRSIRYALADLDGDGDIDLVVGSWTDALQYYENTGSVTDPSFTQRTGTDNPLTGIETDRSGTDARGSRYTFSDLDGDGDLDFVIADRTYNTRYFENTGSVTNPVFTQCSGQANPLADIVAEVSDKPTFMDLDGDGDLDLAMGTWGGGSALHYYENIGSVTNPVFIQHTGDTNPFEQLRSSKQMPELADVDGDGDLDLISGSRINRLYFFENTGTAHTPVFTTTFTNSSYTFTLYDTDGRDTLDLNTDVIAQKVDLRPEGLSDVYGLVGSLIIARDTIIERYIAGSGDDEVSGNVADNLLEGRGGANSLMGGAGNDILIGGAGADTLVGGHGLDTASYAASAAAVTMSMLDGTASGGDAEGDTLDSIESLTGSAHADTLIGSAHNDVLAGDGQANALTGLAGNDLLCGSSGDDFLTGGPGADRLVGGAGNDTASWSGSSEGVTVRLHSLSTADGDA